MLLQPASWTISHQAAPKSPIGSLPRAKIYTRTRIIICNSNADHPRIRAKKFREDSAIPCNSHASFKLMEPVEERFAVNKRLVKHLNLVIEAKLDLLFSIGRNESPLQDITSQDKVGQDSDVLRIRGGLKLDGHATISGAKNSALVILAGAICSSGEVKLTGIPDLQDIFCMTKVMTSLGCRVTKGKDGEQETVTVDARSLSSYQPCSKVTSKALKIVTCSRMQFFLVRRN